MKDEDIITGLEAFRDAMDDKNNSTKWGWTLSQPHRKFVTLAIERLKQGVDLNKVEFPADRATCKHHQHPRKWIEEYTTWRCANCGAWYE